MSSLVITTQSAVTDGLGYSYVYAIIFCEKNYYLGTITFLQMTADAPYCCNICLTVLTI